MKNERLNVIEYDIICGINEQDTSGRCSDNYHIFYTSAGCGNMRIEGADISFSSGDFCLVHPLAFYRISAENDKDLHRFAFSFPKEKIDGALLTFLDSLFPNGSPCAVVRGIDADDVHRVISTLTFADKLEGEVKQQYVFAIISQLLAIISSSSKKDSYTCSEDMIYQVADFISDNLERNKALSLDEIAKTFFVSKFYLCREFKKHNGISIHAYMNHKRMMIARQYIKSGMSAKDASKMVGYTDYSAFYRAYVKVVGKSPKSHGGE